MSIIRENNAQGECEGVAWTDDHRRWHTRNINRKISYIIFYVAFYLLVLRMDEVMDGGWWECRAKGECVVCLWCYECRLNANDVRVGNIICILYLCYVRSGVAYILFSLLGCFLIPNASVQRILIWWQGNYWKDVQAVNECSINCQKWSIRRNTFDRANGSDAM